MRSPFRALILLGAVTACTDGPSQPSATEPVAAITFAQSADTLLRGAVDTITVTLTDARQRALTNRVVTWTSSDTTIARVEHDTSHSVARGTASVVLTTQAVGTVTLTARVDSVVATATIVVQPIPVRRVDLSMFPFVPNVGDTGSLRLVLRDSINRVLDDRPATFTAQPADVLTVTEAGHVTARKVGLAVVTATVEGVRDTMYVTVRGEQIATVTLDPRALLLGPGAALPVRAWLKDARDVQIVARPVTYRSSNPSVATVDGGGVIRTVAPGTAHITAAAGIGLGTIPVTVVAPTPSAFPIDIVWTGDPNPALEAIFREAATRWARVITGALPPSSVTLTAGQCARNAPGITLDQHRGLTIFAIVDSIDGPGGVLGNAGPCVVRGPDAAHLPLLGVMRFDRDDLASMLERGTARDVVLHEMGHVFGIGILWNLMQPHVPPVDSGLPRYHLGPNTAQQAYDLGFADTPIQGAPVETEGGGGTAGSHWKDALFQSELMTGWIGGTPNPLSAVTVAALRDLGYTVDFAGADGFSVASTHIPGFSPPIVPVLGGQQTLNPTDDRRIPLHDQVLLPRWSVDRQGRLTPIAPSR